MEHDTINLASLSGLVTAMNETDEVTTIECDIGINQLSLNTTANIRQDLSLGCGLTLTIEVGKCAKGLNWHEPCFIQCKQGYACLRAKKVVVRKLNISGMTRITGMCNWVDQVERYLKILMPLYSKVLGLAVISLCWDVRYGTIPKLRRFP